MRIRLLSLSILGMLWGTALAQASAPPTYYLALGDSLAVGVQPSASGVDASTDQGYADDLYALFRPRVPGLALTKLGCSGETTTTMIEGGVCTYAEGSQLAAAVGFLQTHQVRLITLDIGANDIDHCVSLTGIDTTCITDALASVAANLPQILTALRTAAPKTRIIAMNYYDPFLAAWTLGASGQTLARATLKATAVFNSELKTIYQAFSVPVANVAHAYRIGEFTLVPVVKLPVNVFLTLTWTWMGAPAPYGPDIHPNAIGYAAIAGAFVEKIGTL